MSRFTIGIVNYDTYVHARCFEDFARALADALRALGHDVVPPTDARPGRLIVLGGNNLTDPAGKLPEDAILYNSEQVSAIADAKQFINVDLFRKHVVWDYSEANAKTLREHGFERVVMCPVGYMPSMTKIDPVANEDIDVLFYGSENARRREVFAGLAKAGIKFHHLYGVYGKERDEYIARSKIVLNLHYYEGGVFEIFRVSHLLANTKCVVSEGYGNDEGLEAFAEKATFRVAIDQVVSVCEGLLADDKGRYLIARRGFEEFKKSNLVCSVMRALEQSGEGSGS